MTEATSAPRHFLCSTFGSSGDVFPMLGLALELHRRGCQVTFATNAHFERLVRGYGLPFEPLGTDAEYEACTNHPDLWHPLRAFKHVFKFLSPVLKQQYDLHLRLAARGDIVSLTNCFGFGALNAQEKLGIPTITVHLQPAVIWSRFDPPTNPGMFGPRWLKDWMFRLGERFFIDPVVCPFLNSWRAELGLPPVKRITRWWNSRSGVLCLFPDWFAAPQPDWPQPLMQTEFPLWNHRPSETLSPALTAFLDVGQPPIVFTPGSANRHGGPFFAAAVEACRRLNRRGLLITEYAAQLPASLPANILHVPYVPFDLLLPRSAAFVHHGGIGSTSQGMLAAVPQVLMPLAHDQFDNAARVQRLGVGDGLPVKQFTGPKLAAMLDRLLTSEAVRSACRQVSAKLTPRDGLSRSADAVLTHLDQMDTPARAR